MTKPDRDDNERRTCRTDPHLEPIGFRDRPRRVGRYEIVEEIGRGGMGIVYRAHDPHLSRSVAVKVIGEAWRVNPRARDRLRQEAEVTAQVQHPNIVPVLDVGTENEELFYVMPLVEGESLEQRLQREPNVGRQQTKLLNAFVRICHATAHAHDLEILHRDLKPANIMFGAHDSVLVMDWGLAKLYEVSALTPAGGTEGERTTLAGTPGYMAPEQARGERTDKRADVYSLGAILFELLTGHPLMVGVSRDRPWVDDEVNPRVRFPDIQVPDALAEICVHALQPDRAHRLASAAQLAARIEDHLEGTAREERAAGEVERGSMLWEGLRACADERRELEETLRATEQQTESSLPLDHPAKVVLWGLRERLDASELTHARRFGEVVAAGERALSHVDGYPPARALLARAYWHALERAEATDNVHDTELYRSRVLQFGVTADQERLQGRGALTLRTTPSGAEVFAQRIDTTGLVWSLGSSTRLGRTPLEELPLDQGSWLLELRHPASEPVRYPVYLKRARHWDSGPSPVLLPFLGSLPEGFVYVPAGPTRLGGDPDALRAWRAHERYVPAFLIARLPVTVREYCNFLRELREEDPTWAARLPRTGPEPLNTLWPNEDETDPLEFPVVDRYGDRWDPELPVFGVSWDDAKAYVSWLDRTGRLPGARLVREVEYEKAARGADGRSFPWGNYFDPVLCKMAQSRPGRAQPEPVGIFEHDCSIYGVHDLAGTIREWCGDRSFDGVDIDRPVRGGAWSATMRLSRAANRFKFEPTAVRSALGFRVARDVCTPQPGEHHGDE